MKTTLMMAALALVLATPAYAQDKDEARPRRQDGERAFRGPGGPQFRGGDQGWEEPGRYGPPRRGWRGPGEDDELQPGPGPDRCPNCGAPLRLRQGPGFRRGGPDDERGPGPGPRGGGQGYGPGPRFDGPDRPPGPPPGQWRRGGGWGPRPEGAPEFAPRGRGYGRPDWDDEDNPPVRRRGPEREGSD